jgi:hypothetical protein
MNKVEHHHILGTSPHEQKGTKHRHRTQKFRSQKLKKKPMYDTTKLCLDLRQDPIINPSSLSTSLSVFIPFPSYH